MDSQDVQSQAQVVNMFHRARNSSRESNKSNQSDKKAPGTQTAPNKIPRPVGSQRSNKGVASQEQLGMVRNQSIGSRLSNLHQAPHSQSLATAPTPDQNYNPNVEQENNYLLLNQ